MKLARIYFLVIPLHFVFYFGITNAQIFQNSILLYPESNIQFLEIENNPPIAVNDTFTLLIGCSQNSISGDIFLNDYDPDGDELALFYIVSPKVGELTINSQGKFSFTVPDGFIGTLIFEYYIIEVSENNYTEVAEVVIYVKSDYDCDNVADEDDVDDDNDGILDIHEGNGEIDSDENGIPDSFDIDSDHDGITDNEEWQREGFYIHPLELDNNMNGWDDAYDNSNLIEGKYYEAVDSDDDGKPDFIDNDSDDDGISDYIEGNDINNDSLPEISFLNWDTDDDGLDDAFDIISGWIYGLNSLGSNAPLPDNNNNGIRDWRDSRNFMPGQESFSTVDQIFIYPNPTNGAFSINFPFSSEEKNIKLLLFSVNGDLIFEKTITSLQNEINVEKFNSGIYLVKLQSDTFTHAERLIINR